MSSNSESVNGISNRSLKYSQSDFSSDFFWCVILRAWNPFPSAHPLTVFANITEGCPLLFIA